VVKIVTAVAPTPVNVLVSPADRVLTVPELQEAGVKRVSLGPELYANALTALEHAANALRRGDIAAATSGIGFGRIYDLVASAS
jgi:2-methylisocitrate lyase-like PEP mutase family enzyme